MNSTGSNTGTGTNPLNKISSGLGTSSLTGSSDFMQSNSLVAKVVFLLLVLFGFIVLLRIGIAILGYFYGPAENPKLMKPCLVSASEESMIKSPLKATNF